MGIIVQTTSVHPHHNKDTGVPFTNEPRVLVHWDGVANRKQHADLADGVVWVNLSQIMRPGVNMGLNIQNQNSGATSVTVEGSMSPGLLAQLIEKNDASGSAIIDAEDGNFEDAGTVNDGAVLLVSKIYSLLRLTFTVGKPATVSIVAY